MADCIFEKKELKDPKVFNRNFFLVIVKSK